MGEERPMTDRDLPHETEQPKFGPYTAETAEAALTKTPEEHLLQDG